MLAFPVLGLQANFDANEDANYEANFEEENEAVLKPVILYFFGVRGVRIVLKRKYFWGN